MNWQRGKRWRRSFELNESVRRGSVFGGGRYDDLVLRFLGERVPATGASIGVDRLLAALIKLGSSCAAPACRRRCTWARSRVPLVLIYGSDEKAKGTVTLKDLAAGAAAAGQLQKDRTQWRQLRPGQFEVARADLVTAVKDFAVS